MTRQIQLVNHRFVKHVISEIYGRPASYDDTKIVMRALERHVPQYYSDRMREELHLWSKFWRREDAEPFIRVFAKMQVEEWDKAAEG